MFQFIAKNLLIRSTQRTIDKMDPAVNLHIPEDIPMPSISRLKSFAPIVSKINALEKDIERLSDSELKLKTDEFRRRYEEAVKSEKDEWLQKKAAQQQAASAEDREDGNLQLEQAKENFIAARKRVLDSLLPEAFAVVREAGKRVLKMRHFDVQMVGGIVLNNGNIAEMTTGEGKTLVATLPAYLNGLTGEGVHVVTVNDYLARRDCEWMGPLYEFLGLTIGVIQHDMGPPERKKAYACDITYGTNNEFGFDYLRDNMVSFKDEMVQRAHHFAIVDEVDSILIDEARTPLIISGPAEASTDKYYTASRIVKDLKGRRITEKDEIDAKYKEIDLTEGYDYMADEKAKSISLTESGEEKAAKAFGVDNLHDMDTIEYRHHILQALRAKEFFVRDVDYVVKDGQVVIVDEFTGRMMPGRRWSDGLHQAVEAREGIKIERENQTLATITFQNYFRLYDKLSGMTGTAYTEATEFNQIYKLDVVVIPTNKVLQRKNHPDVIYKSVREKFNAVIDDIEESYKVGRPVLVGTISIEKSETISRMLKERNIKHQVLNAKFHEMEAHIIAQAGKKSGVTIATNMAGRGTDIVLGGNAEFLAETMIRDRAKDKSEDEQQKIRDEFIAKFRDQCRKEHDEVIELGGLHVIGTERHESRRIDNQLRGRQGRQGDPGSSRFYVSLEDDLMRLFASDRIIGLMDKLGMEEGQALEHPMLSRALENAQKRVEGHNFEIRKHLIEFDDVMNKQREVIYNLRRTVLESDNVKYIVMESLDEAVTASVHQHLFAPTEGEEVPFDTEGLDIYLQTKLGFHLGPMKEKLSEMAEREIVDNIIKGVTALYDVKENEIGTDHMRRIEKMLLLNTIDSKWKDHLYAMDQLKEGVGLRSYAQRNPLIEYKREGFEMFRLMYASIYQEVAEIIFKIQPVTGEGRRPRGVFSSLPQQFVHNEVSGMQDVARQQAVPSPVPQGAPRAASPEAPKPVRNDGPKVGRNDPCPCGSGKKYKKCHGR